MAVGFTCPVLPGGNRLGVVVETGASAVACADSYQALGLEMPILSEEAQQELVNTLRDSIPASPSLQNPVDILWPINSRTGWAFIQCSRIILNEVDATLVIGYAFLNDDFATRVAALRDETGKPIIVIPGNSTRQRRGMSLLVRRGVPTFTIPERALKVLAAMVRYDNYRRQC